MPRRKKPARETLRCDTVIPEEKLYIRNEDVFKNNWWDLFCFPYILCTRFLNCCVTICSGTNQCLVFWTIIQWIICKITRLTATETIIFSYYFYMFSQIILLTAFFILIWIWFGNTIIIPYFYVFYNAFVNDEELELTTPSDPENRLRFRKYCFRKGEIFDSTVDGSVLHLPNQPMTFLTFIVDVFIYREFY